MKKTVSMLLVLAMVLTVIPMSVFAAEAVTITFDTDFTNELEVGDTFTVTATLENNPTIGTITLSLVWNEKAVQFTGFNMNGRALVSDVLNSTQGYAAPVVNNGKIVAADALGYDLDGVIFTANFEIVGEGELGIGLNTDTASDFQIRNLEGTEDVPANLDFSAIYGLTVGGAPVGPEMPEDAPFTAITTDAGPIVAVEEADWIDGVPYYIVTIPEDATTAYVTAPDQVVMEDYTTGELMATAYAADLSDMSVPLYISYNYEDTADGPKVEIPMYMVASGLSGEVELDFIETHAFGIEGAGYACLGWISFVYDDGAESYAISYDNIVGGTVTATNEDGDKITTAKAGDIICLEYTEDVGYTFQAWGYTLDGQFQHLENGVFNMPEGDITISAYFKAPTYDVTVNAAQNGTVAANKSAAATGEKVTLTVTPAEGYALDTLSVKQGDNAVEVVNNEFTMPAGDVTVSAVFKASPAGYRFAISADTTTDEAGTAVVYVKITGHSNPAISTYNAYDLTLNYDNEKLEFVSAEPVYENDKFEASGKDGKIHIVGVGDAKGFDVKVAKLTFQPKANAPAGPANVTIAKVQVSQSEEAVAQDTPEAKPEHAENDNEADETPGISVIVVPYTVTKPAFVSGAEKVLHGESYTFSYTDTTNYTYANLTVTVGGVAVQPTLNEKAGTYTIENVIGAVVITATQTAKTYNVTVAETTATVTAPDKATYGEDYVFTVTPSEENMSIASVTVTKAGTETTINYTVNENGAYVIAGTDITADFTITVTEKKNTTTVTFSGITADEIKDGLTQTGKIGQKFNFTLNKEEGYAYTAKVGETALEESDGKYTIPAALMVAGGVQVVITKTDNTTVTVDVTEYFKVNGKAMFLVTAKWRDKVLAYGENTMFWSDKYTVTGAAETGAYCWLVVSTDEMNTADAVKTAAAAAIKEAAEGATVASIGYDFDINDTTKVDVNDAQLAYDMYNAHYTEFTETLPMKKFLEADMTFDGKLDTQDVAAVINKIIADAKNG